MTRKSTAFLARPQKVKEKRPKAGSPDEKVTGKCVVKYYRYCVFKDRAFQTLGCPTRFPPCPPVWCQVLKRWLHLQELNSELTQKNLHYLTGSQMTGAQRDRVIRDEVQPRSPRWRVFLTLSSQLGKASQEQEVKPVEIIYCRPLSIRWARILAGCSHAVEKS